MQHNFASTASRDFTNPGMIQHHNATRILNMNVQKSILLRVLCHYFNNTGIDCAQNPKPIRNYSAFSTGNHIHVQ